MTQQLITILFLEDDLRLASQVKEFLDSSGMNCQLAASGSEFFRMKTENDFQLYLLDINLPDTDGKFVCRKLRDAGDTTPILMLTAYSAVQDKVQALEYGADDYLVKPFHVDELLARIKALTRRRTGELKAKRWTIADLTIDSGDMKVTRSGREIVLTPREYKLLELLAQAEGQTVSKQAIAEKVWGINFETGTNTTEVYISFLRNKIDKGFPIKLIHTRTGYGYYLKEQRDV